MSEIQIVRSALERAGRRRRWNRALLGLWMGSFLGAVVSLLILGVYHLAPLPMWTQTAACAAPFFGMAAGLAWGGWRRPDLNQTARWVDHRKRLQERLSTALELASAPQPGQWSELVMADASVAAQDLNPRELLPLRLPRITRWTLLVLALAAGLGFVPEYRSKTRLLQRADQQNIKQVGRQLAELTRHSLEKRQPALEVQKSMEAVAAVGDQLAKNPPTRTEALKELANVTEQLKEQLKDFNKDPTLKRLQQAARSSTGGDASSASSLQKQVESLQQQLGRPVGNPDALDQVKKKLEQLQASAKAMGDQNSPGNDAEKRQMAEALSALSKQVQDLGLQLPELDGAIKALSESKTDLMLKDLQAATNDLEKMRDTAKSLQQLQQQVEKLGKDLPEQLKNGQPEMAQQTLQKMVDQLNSGKSDDQQMQKIQEEVNKAVDPAGNYGDVAKFLKSASQQMQAGKQGEAAKSLDAAAKELGKLMQQMADAQQVESELDRLAEASQAVGTGQGWRAMQGRPMAGQGGEPGRGVGTWAEEGSQWDGKSTAGWDNSGVERPDTEGRGLTDRGEQKPNEGLKPTKVKGQFSPGGQMPSITLKGVSIKGQSRVDYESAAAAAQSDAQSALSQDKVPRAYQGPVKDYFDDLKK